MKNCKKIKAIFVGKSGSMGYKTGNEYLLYINTQKNMVFIQNVATHVQTPYESMTAFLNNWDNIRNI